MLPATCLQADPAYFEDFSAGEAAADWQGDNLDVSQATGTNTSWYLGQLNNDSVTLPLSGLDFEGGNATPNSQNQHSFVTVSYDLLVIGDWTGNNGGQEPPPPHTFAFETSHSQDAGTTRLTTTFSNLPGSYQAFPYDSINNGFYAQNGGKGAIELNTLGFSGAADGYNDAVYRLAGGRNQSFTFDHAVDDLTLSFSAENLDAGATWGITNIKIVTGGVFTWQAGPSVGEGLDGGWDIGEHWANPDPTLTLIPSADDAVEFTAAGDYNVSIHQNTSAGFLHCMATQSGDSTVRFNTIGHTLTLTAGNYNNASVAVADGSGQSANLLLFNSNNDSDSDFNGVLNAETVNIADQGSLTLDGYLDPAKPGTDGDLGNVILNVQREFNIATDGTLDIRYGAILNGGLGGGSASSNPSDDNVAGVYCYVEGTANVTDQSVWNQTGSIWTGVSSIGAVHVTGGSHVNVFQLPFAGQLPAIGGSLAIGGFSGAKGSVTVSDPDSQFNVGQLQVGTTESDGLLLIDNFGAVTAATVSIGSYIGGFSGPAGDSHVKVSHQGSFSVTTPNGQGQLNVGDYFDGRMDLGIFEAGQFSTGEATTDFAVIGNVPGAKGEVSVLIAQAADLHSLFTVTKTLIVGAGGEGILGMNGGGVTVLLGLDADNGPLAIAGDQSESNGLITMFGGAGSSDWGQPSTFDASAGGVVVGNAGFGRLEVYDNAQAFAKTIVMAKEVSGSAELALDGDGADNNHTTLLKVSDTDAGLVVGQAGTATATVLNGALLDTFRATVGGQNGDEGPGTVTVEDPRDPATVRHHELGSLWLVHNQASEDSSAGGTLDIGGEGLGGQVGGSGHVTIGSGGRLGVATALRFGKNGRLDVTGGAVTVGAADPLLMDSTPSRLRVGDSALPAADTSVSGNGVIAADVLVDSGGNLGPIDIDGTATGTLSIIGSLKVLADGNLSIQVAAPVSGSYDSVALLDPALAAPAGIAILNYGSEITLRGLSSYDTPAVGDHFDVLTAAKVAIGALNLSIVGLPSSGWHYGVVSIPGGQALRIQYGAAVQEPGSLSIQGDVLADGLGVSDLLIKVEPGISALTDGGGHYTLFVPASSSGTITPSAAGWVSSPVVRSFTTLATDLNYQDFILSASPLTPPALTLTTQDTLRRVTWYGESGIIYQPETSADLLIWTNYGNPLPGAGGPLSFTFPTAPDPQRFFRVRSGH